MDMNIDRLSQAEILTKLRKDLDLTEMLTVYLSDSNEFHNYGSYCALIPSNQIEQTLSSPYWDLRHDQGMPGAVEYYGEEEKRVEYLRYGDNQGVEPLVIDREFYGMRNNYVEISEEFRLFHRLYHDKKLDQYIKIDDSGNEQIVAIIKPSHVQIRLKEIRQFLAIKEMHLAIQFDHREHSEYSLGQLGLEEGGKTQCETLTCWALNYGSFGGMGGKNQSFSRLLGKRLITPLPKSKSGFWGFAEEPKEKYVEFIIKTDENGDEITHTSNPDDLANYFGANPDAPNYLTAVHFRKQVLDKYYQQPSKYSVDDAHLRCGNLNPINLSLQTVAL